MKEKSILIAEDNLQFSGLLYNCLKKLTGNIINVENGKQALEEIEKKCPTILLLDLQLPETTGIEILKEVENTNIKVIVVSGERVLLNKIPIKSYDFIKCVLIKPVDLETIFSNVNYLLLEIEESNNIEKLQKILDEFDFNRATGGFHYLVECLEEIIRNPLHLKNIEKYVYTVIAQKYNHSNINKIK